ncbi:MAG: hypothetical protein ACC707_05210 [Thiohalomonadales bacterium]
MKSRLNDIPILKSVPTYIEANYYNRIRIGIDRLGPPLRIELMNLRGLDLIADTDAWVCVDQAMNDLPILAWTGFETGRRSSLQEAVACELKFYHSHADLICGSVLGLAYRATTNKLKLIHELEARHCVIRNFSPSI